MFEKGHGDSADLNAAINMDVAFYKIQCFITATQSKIPELIFISLKPTYYQARMEVQIVSD